MAMEERRTLEQETFSAIISQCFKKDRLKVGEALSFVRAQAPLPSCHNRERV